MPELSDTATTALTITGLAVITIVSRGLFLLPERQVPIPEWLQRGLKVAPLAALSAVIVPEIVMTQGQLISTWQDARLPAALAATLWYIWRPGVLGPLLAGLAAYLPLRLIAGW